MFDLSFRNKFIDSSNLYTTRLSYPEIEVAGAESQSTSFFPLNLLE